MRTYPLNSPEAAARILAICLLSDGHLSPIELDLLDRVQAHERLGLSRAALHRVLHATCEDLGQVSQLNWAEACVLDPYTLEHVLAEVDDPDLQRRVLALCVAAVEADEHVADCERAILTTTAEQWGLQRLLLQPGVSNPAFALAD